MAFDREDLRLIVLFTRHWIHYGVIVFVAAVVIAAAVEGLFAR